MSTFATVLQSGAGLWLGLIGGTGIGFIVTAGRVDRLKSQLQAERTHIADLRASLMALRTRLGFFGVDQLPAIPARKIHGRTWTDQALDAAAHAAANLRTT